MRAELFLAGTCWVLGPRPSTTAFVSPPPEAIVLEDHAPDRGMIVHETFGKYELQSVVTTSEIASGAELWISLNVSGPRRV